MRVCIVGGIFGRAARRGPGQRFAPEIVLADGLARMGVEVETAGHDTFRPSRRWDLVHVHHLAEGAIRAASAADRPPLVFTSHDGAIICGRERSLVRLGAFGYVCRRADALVALSRREARFLDEHYGLGPKTAVVRNGIRADVFTLGAGARAAGRPTLLYVGQLIALKGVDVLLRALARLPPDGRPTLRLVYHNASGEPGLRALAWELGLRESVEFAGALRPEQLAAAYAGSDLVVLPSHAEALPSVITEAMLCGTPVVASAVGGIPEQVGDLGHLFPPGSVEGLASALQAALARLPLSQEQRAALRERAMASSNVGAMIQGHIRLYEKVLRGRQGRRPRTRGVVDHFVQSAMALYRRTHPHPQPAGRASP
jgi:glycosyltransferase involved in cell wall biosynthesis